MDGYNIVKQAPLLADLPLEQGRAGLLRWMDAQQPQGSANNRVTVVFDGSPEHFGNSVSGVIEVVFSRNGSADDHIKAMVEHSSTKSSIVVVSDDKGITLYVRSLGARIMGVKQFAPGLFVPPSRSMPEGRDRPPSKGKHISLAKAKQIDDELKKMWGIS